MSDVPIYLDREGHIRASALALHERSRLPGLLSVVIRIQAITFGHHVYLRGVLPPGEDGQRLLRHEAAHVAQWAELGVFGPACLHRRLPAGLVAPPGWLRRLRGHPPRAGGPGLGGPGGPRLVVLGHLEGGHSGVAVQADCAGRVG